MIRKLIILACFFFVGGNLLVASEHQPLKPGKSDKCPVCGMFVHKYPDWTAQLLFTDRSTVYFDGAKDMFKYLLHLDRYNPGKDADQIAEVWVTDYYDMTTIDGRSAYYVIGSDVFGPMGKELIPFSTAQAAREFSDDHGGTAVLTYAQISLVVLQQLE